MRIRTIKPEFWASESLSTISEPALILAVGLLNYADDQGYFNANEKLIKAALFPLREPSRTCPVLLQELSNQGYIELSRELDGRRYGRIVNFTKHQSINKPKPSRIAEIPGVLSSFYNATACVPDVSGTDTVGVPVGTGNREQGTGNREQGARDAPAQAVLNPEIPCLDDSAEAEKKQATAPPEMLELFGRWCRSHPACREVEFMHWQLRTQAYSMEVIQQAVDEWCLNMPTFQGRMNNPPATFAKYLENVNVKKSTKKPGADDGDEWAKKLKDIAELT